MTPSYDELRRIAMEATPGPWKFRHQNWSELIYREGSDLYHATCKEKVNAKFIATFNPKLVLELLDRIKELEGR